ncbi:MAG: hypothetical protein ABJL72_20470 [Roseobacter sp.]
MKRIPDTMARWALWVIFAGTLICSATIAQADITRFFGSYVGSAEAVSADGSTKPRDMSVEIKGVDDGFMVNWTSTTYRADGSAKVKSYTVGFAFSGREGVYAAAMRRNVFGHDVQLDPMRGEPYVWSRVEGDTFSLYSMYVTEDGGYEIQQFDRTLAAGGLNLDFQTVRDGQILRTVSTFLEKK